MENQSFRILFDNELEVEIQPFLASIYVSTHHSVSVPVYSMQGLISYTPASPSRHRIVFSVGLPFAERELIRRLQRLTWPHAPFAFEWRCSEEVFSGMAVFIYSDVQIRNGIFHFDAELDCLSLEHYVVSRQESPSKKPHLIPLPCYSRIIERYE